MGNEIFYNIGLERESDLSIVNGHTFRSIKQQADRYVRWRYCKKQCMSTVLITTDNPFQKILVM